jgi:hypothetical protein
MVRSPSSHGASGIGSPSTKLKQADAERGRQRTKYDRFDPADLVAGERADHNFKWTGHEPTGRSLLCQKANAATPITTTPPIKSCRNSTEFGDRDGLE